MKNYFLFIFAILLSLNMTAQKSPFDLNLLKEASIKKKIELPTKRNFSSSRSGSDKLIWKIKNHVGYRENLDFFHFKTDVASKKYRLVLTSLDGGDADLILNSSNSRRIKISNSSESIDQLEYTAWDLYHDEESFQVRIHGFRATNFELELYEVQEYLPHCDPDNIEHVKEWLCSLCEVNSIQIATYFGRPAFFVSQECTGPIDGGGISVYDCDGNQIAYTGFYSINHVQTDYLETGNYLYRCENNTGSNHGNNDCLTEHDFESMPVGANVSDDQKGGNSEKFSKWTPNSPDGIVTADKTLEINNSKYGFQDVVFTLGIQSRNIYKVSWQMYIESNSLAYFNVQHTNNWRNFKSGGEFRRTFGTNLTQYQGRWFDVELYVDLDRNKLKLIVDDGRYIAEETYNSTLGGINFAAYPNAHFYIDNICMQEVNRIPLTSQENQSSSRSKTNNLDISISNSTPTKATNTNFASFKVFPNPSKGITTVQFEQDNEEDLSIEVFNQTGQIVKQLPVGTQSYINQALDLSDLPNGMYIVKLRGATTNLNQKVLLQQ